MPLLVLLSFMTDLLQHHKKPSWWRQSASYVLEIVKVFLIALAIVIPVRYFLIQPFYVKGASMEPTYNDHEYLIIDELSYRLREASRGEVIVFRYPRNPSQYYIKRIIGLPGDTISIHDNQVDITGPDGATQVLDEVSYLDPNINIEPFNYGEVTLAEDEYFVMGDNRTASYDSRHFGPIKESVIIGRALLRVLPFDKIGWLPEEK